MVFILLLLGLQVLTVIAGFQDAYIHALEPRAAPPQCSVVYDLLETCNSLTPGILSMDATAQAECFCYDSTTWIADAFDSAVQTCANYAKTASPTDYSAIEAYAGFCTSVGDFVNSPHGSAATTSPKPSPAASISSVVIPTPTQPLTTSPVVKPASTTAAPTSVDILTNSACSFVSFALSFCNSATPGFSTIAPSDQAPCLCYSSTVWAPNSFDGAVQTCADFVSTAEPSVYSDIAGIEGYCSSIGDIYKGGSVAAGTTAGSGGGVGGAGLSIPGLGVKSTTSSASAITSPASVPATTSKATSTVAVPTPVLTTSRPSNSSPKLDSTILGLFVVVFGTLVLL